MMQENGGFSHILTINSLQFVNVLVINEYHATAVVFSV